MEIDEETIFAEEEAPTMFESVLGFIENQGWYILGFIALFAYIVTKLWPYYEKWSLQRRETSYEAELKKNPDLYKQKQEELQKARAKFQEDYENKAKIALEKQKEKEQKLLVEKQAKLNNTAAGYTLNDSGKSKPYKPDYNPLMGSGHGSNYRPPRRSRCSGGGCG
ncbi:uncharacterized protein LOC126838139 isoform X2 [Adelges cooleyi]|nr:uncharacterized protein LOC126838139 isoform X2 [Adelges cooleyi]XP_050428258.1 uncharacterized protein LOC126838139 isoform X2 [Adelges cooleyi]